MIERIITTNNLPIKSQLLTLKDVVENKRFYSIPLYQRLYVWKTDQIKTLLEDLESALKSPENYCFLGGIMVKSNNKKYDLIDGQQRYTTIWLLCWELKNELENELEQFIYIRNGESQKNRLTFAIREFANKFFSNPESAQLSKDEKLQLESVKNAQEIIRTFLNSDERENPCKFKKQLVKFLYEKVAFIETEMPTGIDENKLFEVLNNRGIQLQQHEIIKSKLIEKISDNEKRKYAQIWEACSIMDSYIEKNIKEVCGLIWSDIKQKDTNEVIEIDLPDDILKRIGNPKSEYENVHLNKILDFEINKDSVVEKDELDYEQGKVRSIVSFPVFLQHALRIFAFQKQNCLDDVTNEKIPEVNEKKLIETFEKHFYPYYRDENNVKAFIELLFELRICFDNYVIKWIENSENQEIHAIKKLYQDKTGMQRKEPMTNEGFALLQSMLYHSQQITTLYWLTPFLFRTLHEKDPEKLYEYLRRLDNTMFCSVLSHDLSERSWILIGKELDEFQPAINELSEAKGTAFWSYWFYKTDFVLWYLKAKDKGDKWINYRMTSKNSVEHVSPQKCREENEYTFWNENENLAEEVKRKRLDDFGNLVLLSVGMNSEYSNKSFSEKRTSFNGKKRLDSLKSAMIFENEKWNWKLCIKHRNEIIDFFWEYFDKTHNVAVM